MMKSLVWKESCIVWPFVAALAVLTMALYGAASRLEGANSAYWAILILMPNLMALGLPLLQVSQEEESGTLRWQRGLPIPWQSAGLSKVLVGHVAWIVGWVFTAGFDQLCRTMGGVAMRQSELLMQSTVDEQWIELTRLVTFSWLLLGLGYACACLTRTAARSLVLLIIAAIVFAFVSEGCVNWGGTGYFDKNWLGNRELSLGLAIVNATAAFVAFLMAAYWMRRKWLGSRSGWFGIEVHRTPSRTGILPTSAEIATAYRPPSFLYVQAPTRFRALLWQSVRQALGGLSIVSLLLLISILSYLVISPRNSAPWATLQLTLAMIVAGINTFGADGYRVPQKFFPEHGISTFSVWWSRLLVTLIAAACILIVHVFGIMFLWDHINGREVLGAVLVMLVALVVSIVIGMFARHAIVSYLLAAAVVLLVSFYGTFLYGCYPNYMWTGVAALGLMIVLTLPLCRLWSNGERDRRFILSAVGYGLCAVMLSILPILIHREWQSPAYDSVWHSQTLIEAQQAKVEGPIPKRYLYVSGHRSKPGMGVLNFSQQEILFLKDGFDTSDEEPMVFLAWRPNSWVEHFFGTVETQEDDSAYQGMGFGSRREFYANLVELGVGSIERTSLTNVTLFESDDIDLMETLLEQKLKGPVAIEILGDEVCEGFLSRLRTPEQKREQRRKALLHTWLTVQETQDISPFYNSYYMSTSVVHPFRFFLPWEDTFLVRRLDAAVRLSLQQLDSGRVLGPQDNAIRREAWEKMRIGDFTSKLWPTQNW